MIVQPVVSLLFVGVSPFGVDRIGERRAGARDIDGKRGPARRRGDESGCREGVEKFQGSLLFVADVKLRAASGFTRGPGALPSFDSFAGSYFSDTLGKTTGNVEVPGRCPYAPQP